jgi:RHS repeat-associated protein
MANRIKAGVYPYQINELLMKKQYLLILFFSLFITSVFAQPGGGGPGGGGPPGGPVTPNCPTSCKVSGGGNKCAGDIANIVLSCSEAGIVYQLKMGQSNIGSQVNGTGSAINWSVQVSGTYKVVATNTNTNCTLVMQDSAKVIINPLPTQYAVSGGGTLCYGDPGVPVTLSNSQAHVKYQLKRNGTNIGEESTGVNGTLTWPGLATDGNYTIVARDIVTNCTSTMNGSASVKVNVIPSTFTVAGGGTVNSTSGVTVKLNGSFKDTKYQLKLNGKNVGQPVTGNENILSWRVDAPGNYTVVAVNSTTGCKREMNGNAVVEEDRKWSVVNDYAYLYKYDKRQRLIEKKLPGAQCIYMVYDNRDRLVMTQDGEQRKNNQWTFTKYDALNRPVITGLYTHSTVATQAEMSSLINTNIFYETYTENIATHGYSNTVFPINNIDVLTVTYYDDHRFKSLINNDELNYKNNELTGQAPSAFDHVDGKITGSKTKVLNTENTYLWSATYYDDKYSIIQTATTILSGGVARNTYIVDFDGKVKQAKTILHKDGSNDQFTIKTYEYDHAGRLAETWHQINNNPKILLSQNTYNEIGQLVTKKLHASVDNISSFKQHVDYRYNIRGWLSSINNADLTSTDGGPKDYFGMEFGYNNDMGIGAFTPQYSGNISATKWSANLGLGQSSLGEPKARAFKFVYDPLNRLQSTQHAANAGTWSETSAYKESVEYDLNSNIRKLNRTDAKGVTIDKLTYNYGPEADQSNKVLSIADAGLSSRGFTDRNTSGNDFDYNANGNLTKDHNKGIGNIKYNYLNLTEEIVNDNGEKIKYIYNAEGIKVGQEIYEPGATTPKKRTDFVGAFVYEDGVLVSVHHDEGKIVIPAPSATDTSPEYHYEIKDNVGNTRVTFTAKEKTVELKATMEDNGQPEYTNPRVQEMAAFKNLFETEIKNVNQWLNHTSAAQGNAIYLDGSEGRTVGPYTLLKVYPGDKVHMQVFGKYEHKTTHTAMTLPVLLTAMITPTRTALGLEASTTNAAISNLLSPFLATKSNDNARPRADLTYILFDKNLKVIDFDYKRINESAAFTTGAENTIEFDKLELEKVIDRVGYLYIYVSNESPGSRVWMDDLTINLTKSPVIQSEDYYPLGLSMSGTAFERDNTNYKGQVTTDGTGLKDLGFRQYDAAIGRFHAVDPLAEMQLDMSTYQYAGNNPVNQIDVLGLESEFAGFDAGQGLLKGNRHTLDYDPLKRNRQFQKMNFGYADYESPSPDGGGFYKPKPKKGQGGDPRRPHPDNNEESEEDEGIKREVRRILYRPKAKEDFDPKEITVAGPFWQGTKNTFSSTVFNNASHRRPQNQGAGSNIDLGMFINQPVVSTPLANSYARARATSNEEDTREYLITHLPPNEALAIYYRKQIADANNGNGNSNPSAGEYKTAVEASTDPEANKEIFDDYYELEELLNDLKKANQAGGILEFDENDYDHNIPNGEPATNELHFRHQDKFHYAIRFDVKGSGQIDSRNPNVSVSDEQYIHVEFKDKDSDETLLAIDLTNINDLRALLEKTGTDEALVDQAVQEILTKIRQEADPSKIARLVPLLVTKDDLKTQNVDERNTDPLKAQTNAEKIEVLKKLVEGIEYFDGSQEEAVNSLIEGTADENIEGLHKALFDTEVAGNEPGEEVKLLIKLTNRQSDSNPYTSDQNYTFFVRTLHKQFLKRIAISQIRKPTNSNTEPANFNSWHGKYETNGDHQKVSTSQLTNDGRLIITIQKQVKVTHGETGHTDWINVGSPQTIEYDNPLTDAAIVVPKEGSKMYQFTNGDPLVCPVILLHYDLDEKTNDELKFQVQMGVDLAALALGGYFLSTAEGMLFYLGVIEVSAGSFNVTLNAMQETLVNDMHVPVETVNTIRTIATIVELGTAGLSFIQNASELSTVLRPKADDLLNFAKLNPEKFTSLTDAQKLAYLQSIEGAKLFQNLPATQGVVNNLSESFKRLLNDIPESLRFADIDNKTITIFSGSSKEIATITKVGNTDVLKLGDEIANKVDPAKVSKLTQDVIDQPALLKAMGDDANLANAWSKLDDAGVEHLRKNTDFLETISKYIDGNQPRKLDQFGLSIEEEAIVRHYTGPSHTDINNALKEGQQLSSELTEYKTLLNSALNKLPNYVDDVFRGLGKVESEIAKGWNVGQKINDPTFVSSSKFAEVAEDFMLSKQGDVRLVIQSKTGKVVEAASAKPLEAEVLFKTDRQFEVVNKYPFPLDDGRIITEIVLKEL